VCAAAALTRKETESDDVISLLKAGVIVKRVCTRISSFYSREKMQQTVENVAS